MDDVTFNPETSEANLVLESRYVVGEHQSDLSTKGVRTRDFCQMLDSLDSTVEQIGKVVSAYGTTVYVTGLTASIGQRCKITTPGQSIHVLADVVGITGNQVILFPMGNLDGLSNRSEVRVLSTQRCVRFSESMIGCIMDGSGKLVYQPKGQLDTINVPIYRAAPDPLTRRSIDKIFSTGVKVIDTLLTVGEGQRVGIFASAGGGKSTLLAMLARYSTADVVVIGLIGERGREVREFIEHNLGKSGLARCVMVVTTSDRPAIERVNAALCATTIAENFRAMGKRVLLLMDSLTRYARALREIGLSVGELPVRQGFPPSVFSELPKLLERSGNDQHSSITAFYTILEDDEESSDPVSEEVRSILDGHIVLSRNMGETGVYPPVDVLSSASRLIGNLATSEHLDAALRVRQLIAKYQEIELLIQVGEYKPGSDADADDAVNKREAIKRLVCQHSSEQFDFNDSVAQLRVLVE